MTAGGSRPGSGRPKADPRFKKIAVGYKLPAWLVQWIRSQETSAAVLIEDALRKVHKISPPS